LGGDAGLAPINPGFYNDLYVNGNVAIVDLNCAIKYIPHYCYDF
jgi:hypothetical protein